jgi:hypothetical protein
MSTPLSTIYEGDFTLRQGSDVSQFGWGDMSINRILTVHGTQDSINSTTGSLIVHGGFGLAKDANLQSDLNVIYGITNLAETFINTNNGGTQVSGSNSVIISVGAASQFTSTNGNLTLSSTTQKVLVQGGLNGDSAVTINATSSNGGVELLSGSGNGKIALTSGAGGIIGYTSSGNINLTANNASGSLTVNSLSASQNLDLTLAGSTDSQLLLQSSGINTTLSALKINTTNTSGNIQISNADGLGSGSITTLTGSGGYTLSTNTSGPISFTSNSATTQFIVDSSSANQNLNLDLDGNTDSQISISSSGINTTRTALLLQTTNTAGNIAINQIADSEGSISLYSGSNGINLTTQTGGSITQNAYSATSLYTNTTLSDNQHLTVSVTGSTNSKVIIDSDGTGTEAVTIRTSTNTGGILISSLGQLSMQSANTNLGVKIATTTSNVPVFIGTTNSVTTINGDLIVKGTTTEVESEVVTVTDNIIIVNNAPVGISDGGIGIKRYQYSNNTSAGEVVSGTGDETGTATSGNTATTINLGTTASAIPNYYSGWWIKLTGGTGAGQVRRINTYDQTTQIATIYSSTDHSANPTTPIEGLDFLTIPDDTTTYSLYQCYYVFSIWDESNNEFAFTCSPNSPADQVSISEYANLHINNMVANNITAQTINNVPADTIINVTLVNNSTTPVTMTDFPAIYGVFNVMIRPTSTTTRTHAIFNIARVNDSLITGISHRILSIRGSNNEQLDIQWPANQKPQLLYRPAPGTGGTTEYTLRITTV